MMLIPVIWLKDGRSVNLSITGSEEIFTDPLVLAKLWRIQNAKAIHLELDSEHANQADLDIAKTICESFKIPVVISLPEHLLNHIDDLLECGIARVIIDRAIESQWTGPDLQTQVGLRQIGLRFSLLNQRQIDEELIGDILLKEKHCRMVLKMRRDQIGEIQQLLARLKERGIKVKTSVQTPISNFEDLNQFCDFKSLGLDSIFLPKEIYSNIFPCQEMWCWNDPTKVDLSRISTAKLRSEKGR